MNPARIIVQVVLTGTQIFARAFAEAYRQTSQQAGSSALKSADALTRLTGMSLQEANAILNVEKNATLEDIKKNYKHLFEANDPEKGGSFYLQSKVYRAKERLDLELSKQQPDAKAQ